MPRSERVSAISERFATALRGFGPVGILAILLIFAGNLLFVPLSALLVLLWRYFSQTPWHDLGLIRPQNWIRTIVIGIAFGVALKFLMKAIVMPLLGAPPINWAYHFVAHNPAALPMMFYLIIIGAGFGEETFFRGWMFERLGKLFGHGELAKIAIVLTTSALFAAAHYGGQGIPGVEQALVVGIVFGSVFAVTGRIFMLMIAHTAFDLTALWMIYYGMETRIAHLIFNSP